MTIDVAVIGGGVSGLATAYRLAGQGQEVVVLERQRHPGGNAISERIGDYLFERGPSSMSPSAAEAVALGQALGLDTVRCDMSKAVRNRYLLRGGAVRRIAGHPLGIFTSGYLSPLGRLRILGEPFARAKRDDSDESITQFCSRRFGAEFADYIINPFIGGIYAARTDDLSMPAVFPALVEMERNYGSVILGAIRRKKAGGAAPGKSLYSWREGIATLPLAMAQALGDGFRGGVAVERITPRSTGFQIDTGDAGTVEVKSVVLAVPPDVAARLLEGLDGAGAEAAAGIVAPPVAAVFLGYARSQIAHPLDGMGYLTPEREGRAVSGILFTSTMFPGRAPEDHVALTGYVSSTRVPGLARMSAEDLIAMVQTEARDLLGAKGAPDIARVQLWPSALPQCRLGHGDRVAALRGAEQRVPGLFLTGNYFTGPSVGNCIAQAEETVTRAQTFLTDDAQVLNDPAAMHRRGAAG